MTIEPSEVYLSIRHAIPCALILNELVTNSLKHAFVDRAQGRIQISFHNLDDNYIQLRVMDNGKGISEKLEAKSTGALGLELVKHLVVGQLNGEMMIRNNDGTDIYIKFKRIR
jgi:two-component sensor histidine kinase